MKIKGAIFDMDGTLVDSLFFWDSLYKKIGIRYLGDESFRPGSSIERAVRTMIYSDAMAYLNRECRLTESTEEFWEFTSGGVADFYRNEAKAKSGASELLEYLKDSGVKIVLASATTMNEIKIAIEHYGLAKYFDFVFSCADIGVGKERPDIYLMASEALGFKNEDVCVVEDSYVALETAKNAGFQTVGVFDKYSFGQDRLKLASDIYIDEAHTLASLTELLEPKI